MNNELKCPECDHNLDDLLNQTRNKMAGLAKENSHLVKELNRLVKDYEKKEAGLLVKIKERDRVINSLKSKIEDLVKSTETAFVSQQSKGEAVELILEEILQQTFPRDIILPVAKGVKGADALQVITTDNGVMGQILFETKNTKTFSDAWITKLKEDNLEAKADILILVTQTMPKGCTSRFMIKENVWICSLSDVKDLTSVLRDGLIKLATIAFAQKDKDVKDKLFSYLSSNAFRNSFENIFNNFKMLQQTHNEEKLKLSSLWKQREKALEQILTQSMEFYSDLTGVAGVATFPQLSTLEISQGD